MRKGTLIRIRAQPYEIGNFRASQIARNGALWIVQKHTKGKPIHVKSLLTGERASFSDRDYDIGGEDETQEG